MNIEVSVERWTQAPAAKRFTHGSIEPKHLASIFYTQGSSACFLILSGNVMCFVQQRWFGSAL